MKTHRRVLRKALQLFLFVGMLVALPLLRPVPVAHAATRIVSDCSAPSGAAGRLVDQIAAASSGDTINFSCNGTITLAARITISKNLTIDGTGRTVTISGGGAVKVMRVSLGFSLTLNNLTIANGLDSTLAGGGIENEGTLNVTNSTFSGNIAGGESGGGIYNGGTLTVTTARSPAIMPPMMAAVSTTRAR